MEYIELKDNEIANNFCTGKCKCQKSRNSCHQYCGCICDAENRISVSISIDSIFNQLSVSHKTMYEVLWVSDIMESNLIQQTEEQRKDKAAKNSIA